MIKSMISTKLSSMSKEEILSELSFYQICEREMPSKQNRYEISVIKNYLSLFFQVGSITSLVRELSMSMNPSQKNVEEDAELMSLLEEIEAR